MTSKARFPAASDQSNHDNTKRVSFCSKNLKAERQPYANEEEGNPSYEFQLPSFNHEQQRKTVTFSQYDDEYNTLHIADFSLEEIIAYWYQNDELESIQLEIGATILAMARRPISNGIVNRRRNDKLFAKGFLCARGLEAFRPEIYALKNKHMGRVWDTVLDEQYKQWSSGRNCNPNAIAYACRTLTRRSVAVARLRAISDERECLAEELLSEKQQQSKRKAEPMFSSNKIHKPQDHDDSGVKSLLQKHAVQSNNNFIMLRNRPSTVSSRAA